MRPPAWVFVQLGWFERESWTMANPKNIAQWRAANAMDRAAVCRKRQNAGDCLPGYPGLIINNGLLATVAFAIEKSLDQERINRNTQWWAVSSAVAFHLTALRIFAAPVSEGVPQAPDALTLRNSLVQCDGRTLRRATDEALAFLGYLKRFAKIP
jgi:CRISPR/Cas system CMR-associated protein Cmr5 small subunit